MARHLVGLQAQEPLPPYLSLHARLTAFDPYDVTRALEERTLVRLLTMRGTIHLLTPEDALALRPWTQVGDGAGAAQPRTDAGVPQFAPRRWSQSARRGGDAAELPTATGGRRGGAAGAAARGTWGAAASTTSTLSRTSPRDVVRRYLRRSGRRRPPT